MKPMDMGYQQARGIGNVKFDTEQNMSLEPETQAIRKSALPNALGYIAQQTPYITESLKSLATGTKTAGAAASSTVSNITPTVSNTTPLMANTSLLPTSQVASVPMHTWNSMGAFSNTGSALSAIAPNAWSSGSSALQNAVSTIGNTAATTTGGITSQVVGTMADKVAQTGGQLLSNSAQQAVDKAIAQSLPTKLGTPTLGTALGAIGTAIGGYTMANQIADFGSHRSGSDMMANVGRQHITTDRGNSYTNYNGVNMAQEVALENANTRAKQLGFGMNAIGTGASLGGAIGSVVPGLGNLIGTGIGAAAGLLLGGLGSLFGWGDNEEEVRRQVSMTNDNIAMYNRQQEAVAKSKDVAAEFSDRQGVATAAEGKNAYGPMNSKKGDNINTPRFVFDIRKPNNIGIDIPSSRLMPGETVVNKEDLSQWAVVPGKGNKDNVYSTVEPGDSNVVLTKKEGISKLGAAVLKSNAPESLKRWQINELEKRQQALQEQENQTGMKKYKNGKLPGYWRGTDYLMSAIPHLAALGSSLNQYNRAKYADMPDYPNIVDSSANTQAINILGGRRFNPAPLLEHIHRTHRNNLYDINRTPGLTAGGQAIARANNAVSEAQRGAEVLAQADEINNKYTADYANALANYGKMMSEMMTNNNYARAAFKQQQNAAKEGWMAQYQKNGLTALADLASDIMGVRQFNRSEDYQDRLLELYNQQVKNDKVNAQAALANAEQARLDRQAAYDKAAKEAVENTHPMFLNQGIFRPDGLWNAYGDKIFNYKLTYPQIGQKYAKYFKPVGYEDGKKGFVSRGSTLGQFYEEIQPDNLFGIGGNEYSTKMITDKGDTVYQIPSVLFRKDVIRKKGGPASKEYIKAKQRHDRLLKNATPSNNIGMDQLLRMFGF